MDSSEESDKKMNKAKSYSSSPVAKLKNEPAKRKSFNVSDEPKSLDPALVRLKKSKLVNGESITTGYPAGHPRCGCPDMFMDISSNSTFCPGIDNASLMSMNFSHYELARNLSSSICNSEGAYSSTGRLDAATDNTVKNEHLERFFRSAEMWSQKYRNGGPSNPHFHLPEK